MSVYNISQISNPAGIVGYTGGVNTLSGGLIGIGLIIFVAIITYSGSKNIGNDAEKSVLLSLAITSSFAALLFFLQLIIWQFAIVPLLCFILMLILKAFGD